MDQDTARNIQLVHDHAVAYGSLPVVIAEGEGAWVRDVAGNRYLDLVSAYSAMNFGHRHPALVAALEQQLQRVTLTSRAVYHDQLGPFCQELAALLGMDAVIPLSTGAEAVETAVKGARRWAYEFRGVPDDQAEIIVAEGNFHGRTTTMVGLSSDRATQRGFGPFTPGFVTVPYGDAQALEQAMSDRTAAVLLEPIQGEGGVWVPPAGYLRRVRELCDAHGVLFIADEIQTGLGRTGATLACDHEGVRPDLVTVGKPLSGGMLPLSALAGRREVMDVFTAGSHGSTFAGNPLACAVGRAVIELLRPGDLQRRATQLGERLRARLHSEELPAVAEVRGKGLWAGIDLAPAAGSARGLCERLLQRGVLCKESRERTLRLAPPLIISTQDLDWGLDQLIDELRAAG